MPEIIPIASWSEWIYTVPTNGYSLSKNDTVEDCIARFERKFGYQPDKVWVWNNQVRIELRGENHV